MTSNDLKYKFTALGTQNELIFRSCSEEVAVKLAKLAISEISRIETKYSQYLLDSEISRINSNQGVQIQIDEETSYILKMADHFFEFTKGLFDPSCKKLADLWKFGGSNGKPTDKEIASALEFVGWNKIDRGKDWIRLPIGMKIELGGIGKEYAVDRVFELISKSGGKDFLVNLGGDVRCTGSQNWQIGIDLPDGKIVSGLNLIEGACISSGNGKRGYSHSGTFYSHIISPLTGYPISAINHVSIVADTALIGGVITKLCIFLDFINAVEVAKSLGHLCLILDNNGSEYCNF